MVHTIPSSTIIVIHSEAYLNITGRHQSFEHAQKTMPVECDSLSINHWQSLSNFLSELPCNSQESLRQEMKKLADEGKLIRVYNGVYYKPYKTIMGTEGRMSINKYIEKKYVYNNKKVSGFISGLGLYNKYGFTSQVPSVIEVTSNIATTKQRKINVDGYDIIVYKPIIEITDNNINELEFMSLMTDIDQFSEISGDELKMKLEEYINKKNIDFNIVKNYLPLFPDKIYKSLYNGGLMNELV